MTDKEKTDIIIEAAELAGYQYNRVENNKEYDGNEYPNVFVSYSHPDEILSFTDRENWQGTMRDVLFSNLDSFFLEDKIDENVYNKIESLLLSIPLTEFEIDKLKKQSIDNHLHNTSSFIKYNEEKSLDGKICFTHSFGKTTKQDIFFNSWEQANKKIQNIITKSIDNAISEKENERIEGIIGNSYVGQDKRIEDNDLDNYDSYDNRISTVCIAEAFLDGDEHLIRIEAEINEQVNIYKLNTYMYGEYKTDLEYLVGTLEFDNIEELVNTIQKFDIESLINEDLLNEVIIEDANDWLESDEFIDDDFSLEDDFGDDDDNPEWVSIVGKLHDKADKVKAQPHIDNDIDIDDLDIN